MARPYLDGSEAERENLWLELVEMGVSTTAEIASMSGLTQRRVQQRLAMARARQAEGSASRKGREDLPWVPIVNGRIEGHHYNLRHDELSNTPSGPFRIGTGNGYIQVANGAAVKEKVGTEEEAKAKAEEAKAEEAQPKSKAKLLTREQVDAIMAKHRRPRAKRFKLPRQIKPKRPRGKRKRALIDT